MKWLSGCVLITVIVGLLFAGGCTSNQKTTIARHAGMASAVTWLGVDNPTTEEIAAVQGIVNLIQTNVARVAVGGSYYTVIMPIAQDYITVYAKPNIQPMCSLGAAWLLSGIDLVFALNPSWATEQQEVCAIAQAFCEGAKQGLALAPDSPAVMAAKGQTDVRVVRKRQLR
jgi:hypothetical protein